MTQSSVQTWCDGVQTRLMAALDAAWAIIDTSDDPAEVRKARDKAKAGGELAANARKIAALTPMRKVGVAVPVGPAEPDDEPRPPRAIDRLKGGGRGRL
jgi:hypothetical protein